MDIAWLGLSSFLIRGKKTSIVTDPYTSEMVGFKFPRVNAGIVTVSHDHADHNNADAVQGNPYVVKGPGEYEISGVSIFGIPSYHDKKRGEERGLNTIYTMEVDSIRLCHLGDLGHKLDEKQVGEIGQVDILFVPVGGYYTIDVGEAAEVVSQLEPSVVIPMHFQTKGLNQEVFGALEGVDKFVKELGLEPTGDGKYSVTEDKLPEEMQLVILEQRKA